MAVFAPRRQDTRHAKLVLRSRPYDCGVSARRARRRGVFRPVAGALALVLVGAGIWVAQGLGKQTKTQPPCSVSASGGAGTTGSYALDLEQAANATTITAVGKRLGLADHAITVALAAAFQESGLRNLLNGDRDSIGLFQQRPSQGWGTRAQILVPTYAATVFYQRLAQVPNWETMAVTEAAQAVQISAAPNAYSQWEAEARVLARVMTGETPAGLTCVFGARGGPVLTTSLTKRMRAELGTPTTATVVSTARGWTVASWLVGHAQQFGIGAVTFDGLRWTPRQSRWVPDPRAQQRVDVYPFGG
jgi:hypothetical protein